MGEAAASVELLVTKKLIVVSGFGWARHIAIRMEVDAITDFKQLYEAVIAEKRAQIDDWDYKRSRLWAILDNIMYYRHRSGPPYHYKNAMLSNEPRLELQWVMLDSFCKYYPELLKEDEYDVFFDYFSWFPGLVPDVIARNQTAAWKRRRHLLSCW